MLKRKIIAISSVIILVLCAGLVYKFRFNIQSRLTHYHLYHEIKRKLLPFSKYAQGNMNMKYYYNPEESGSNTNSKLSPKWWFRPSHMGTFFSPGLVDDADNDGQTEVYIYGGSNHIYCLDGKSGELIWRFTLPFGRVGALAAILDDIDGDNNKELIVGSHTDLPIRVYCLSTKKNDPTRIKWFTNVHGDFLQGGLVSMRNKEGQVRIIAATRDAPYSRGTLNVLDSNGKHLYPPIFGVDVCNHRPSISDVNNDGYFDMILGSHNYYGAEHGHKVTAFTIDTGEIIWSTPVGFDTGVSQFPVVDIDNDGKTEVLADSKILNASDGSIVYDLNRDSQLNLTSVPKIFNKRNGSAIFWADSHKVINRQTKKTIYKFNDFPRGAAEFFLDLDQDSEADYLNAYLHTGENPHVKFYLFDAQSGDLKQTIDKRLDDRAYRAMREDLPSQQELRDFAAHGTTRYSSPEYLEKTVKLRDRDNITRLSFILADVDEDMHWEALCNYNSVVFCFDLPFAIPREYNSLRARSLSGDPLRDHSGFNYDLSKRAYINKEGI